MNIRLILKRSVQLLLVPMFAFVVGCNEQDPDAITVDGSVSATVGGDPISVLTVSSEGGEYTVYPSTDTWSVESSADWCVAQRDNCETYDTDKSLDLYIYGANDAKYGMTDGETNRVAFVTFTYGVAEYSFVVSQGQSDDYIILYPTSATVGYEAYNFSIPVIASVGGESLTVNSSASWATVTFNTDYSAISVAVAENASEESRVATITVGILIASGGDYVNTIYKTFELTQEGRSKSYVAASIEEYTFAAAADSYEVALTTNVYEPSFAISSNQTWCEASAVVDGKFTIYVEANEVISSREAKLVITATSEDGTITVSDEITVYQAGVGMPSLSIGTTTYTYTYGAANESISFIADGDVTVAVDSDWVKNLTSTNEVVTFSLEANTGSAARTANLTIYVTKGGETVSKEITITQEFEALVFEVSPEVIEVYVAGDEKIVFTATTNAESITWVEPTASWIDGSEGTYEVFENESGYTRTCTIVATATLAGQEIVKELTVIQYATIAGGTTYEEPETETEEVAPETEEAE